MSKHFIFKIQASLEKKLLYFWAHKAQFRFAPVPRKIGFSRNRSTDIENFKNTEIVQFEISSLTWKLNIRNLKR